MQKTDREKGSSVSGIRNWRNTCSPRRPSLLVSGCGLVCVVVLLRLFFCLSIVTGASMLPTLQPGDLLVVNKWAYRKAAPRRGDLVVIRDHAELMIKRIVGLPGEEVEVVGGRLHVNGILIPELYGTNDGFLGIGKGRLLEGRFATLGDNRTAAPEVVVVPIISKAVIMGKVVVSAHLGP